MPLFLTIQRPARARNIFTFCGGFVAAATVILFSTFCIEPIFARQQNSPSKEPFKALYARRDSALQRKDVDGYMKLIAQGYQSFDMNGTVHIPGKDQEQDRLTRVLGRASAIDSKTVVLAVSIVNKDAVVTTKNNYTRTQSDPERNLTGKLNEVGTYRDLWVSTSGEWQIKRSRTLSLSTTKTMNGKKVE